MKHVLKMLFWIALVRCYSFLQYKINCSINKLKTPIKFHIVNNSYAIVFTILRYAERLPERNKSVTNQTKRNKYMLDTLCSNIIILHILIYVYEKIVQTYIQKTPNLSEICRSMHHLMHNKLLQFFLNLS